MFNFLNNQLFCSKATSFLFLKQIALLFLNNSKHIALTHDEILGSFKLDLCARIFTIKNLVTFFKNHRLILSTLSNSNNCSMLGLLLCCIWNNDSTNFLFSLCR